MNFVLLNVWYLLCFNLKFSFLEFVLFFGCIRGLLSGLLVDSHIAHSPML